MFTGIIEEIGILQSIRSTGGKKLLSLECPRLANILKPGDSVCCNGICLTVNELSPHSIEVEVMQETLQKTTAGSWKTGDKINLEPALPVNGRLNGHIVQGHIDTLADFLYKELSGETVYLWFKLPAASHNLIVPQGSIAINGISLTIARITEDRFAVALISYTWKNTNLSDLPAKVNLEFDIIGKYINQKNSPKTKLTMEWLHEQNF